MNKSLISIWNREQRFRELLETVESKNLNEYAEECINFMDKQSKIDLVMDSWNEMDKDGLIAQHATPENVKKQEEFLRCEAMKNQPRLF